MPTTRNPKIKQNNHYRYTCGWILVVNVNGATKSMRIWSGSHALRKFYENWMDESAHRITKGEEVLLSKLL
ncbi:hypothetical protein GBA52_024784 [Prunus armeniaca]|nr:hypothetical protein GBA52_024784 [Prunus armeniaca]